MDMAHQDPKASNVGIGFAAVVGAALVAQSGVKSLPLPLVVVLAALCVVVSLVVACREPATVTAASPPRPGTKSPRAPVRLAPVASGPHPAPAPRSHQPPALRDTVDERSDKVGFYKIERDAQGRILSVEDLTGGRPKEYAPDAVCLDGPPGMQWPAFPRGQRRYLN